MRRFEQIKSLQKEEGSDTSGFEVANVQVSTFRLFVIYIYSGHISPEVTDNELLLLLQFAQTYRCHAMASYIVSSLLGKAPTTSATVHFMLNNYCQDLALYQLLADEVAQHLTSENVVERVAEYPSPFALLIMKALLVEREIPKDASQPVESQRARNQRQVRTYMHPGSSPNEKCLCWAKDVSAAAKLDHGIDFYSDTAVILIGPEELSFVVHKGVTARHSEYFRAAFSSGFSESASGVIKLPEEEAGVFCMFLEWLYNGVVDIPRGSELARLKEYELAVVEDLEYSARKAASNADQSASKTFPLARVDQANESPRKTTAPMTSSENIEAEEVDENASSVDHDSLVESSSTAENDTLTPYSRRHLLAALYAFSSRRLVPALGNQIMNLLISTRYTEERESLYSGNLDLVDQVFDTLPATSSLCKFLIDEAAWCWESKDELVTARDKLEGAPAAFSSGVIRRLLEKNENPGVEVAYWKDVCAGYHEHATEEKRRLCKLEMEDWYLEQGIVLEPEEDEDESGES
jgi:hypothetical protein